MNLDISANRRLRKWTRSELVGRTLWEFVGCRLFAWSPRLLWGWRRFVLRAFGAKVGRDAHFYPSVKIPIPWNLVVGDQVAIGDGAILYCLGQISIGARTTISQYAHLCAGSHNYRVATFDLVKASIDIGSDAWICADVFVGPGVKVGDLAILGARCVVMRDVVPNVIVAGNPARQVGIR